MSNIDNIPPKNPNNQFQPPASPSPDKANFESNKPSRALSPFEANLVEKWDFTPDQAKKFTQSMVNMINQQIQKDLKKSREKLKEMFKDED